MTRRTASYLAALFVPALLTACSSILGVPDIFLDPSPDSGADGTTSPPTDGATTVVDGAGGDAVATCGGTEVDLRTDNTNCGACGQDCTAGRCADGLCTMADNVYGLQGAVVQDPFVYASYGGEEGGFFRCAKKGCLNNTPNLWTSDGGTSLVPLWFAVNDTYILSADNYSFNGGGIARLPIAGGLMSRLPPGASGLDRSLYVAIDGTYAYWSAGSGLTGSIQACALPDCVGGLQMLRANIVDPSFIAVAPTGQLIWAENQGSDLHTCAGRTNCGSESALATFAGVITELKIYATTTYWSSSQGIVYSCETANCTSATTVASGQSYIASFAVADNTLYFANYPRGDAGQILNDGGTIHSCTIDKCSATTKLIAKDQKAPAGLTTDSTSVYWVNSGSFTNLDQLGTLMKAAR